MIGLFLTLAAASRSPGSALPDAPVIVDQPADVRIETDAGDVTVTLSEFITGSGITYALVWSLGAVPAGITLSSGVVTISDAAAFPVGALTVTATNAGGSVGTAFEVEVVEIIPPQWAGVIENVDIIEASGNVTRDTAPALSFPAAGGAYSVTVNGVTNAAVATINSSTGVLTVLDDVPGEYAIAVTYTASTGAATYGLTAVVRALVMPLFADGDLASIILAADDPRGISATAERIGTPTVTPLTAFLNTIPVKVSTTQSFHVVEFRDMTGGAGDRMLFAAHIKQDTAPNVRLKVRDGAAVATETLFTFTWSGGGITRNNTSTLANVETRVTDGLDGTKLIEIEGDLIAGTSALTFGVGPNSSTAQTVDIYTMAVALVAVSAPAVNTLYIATTGNDTTGAGTLANPWRTFDKALREATPNTVISVADGTYTENIRLKRSLYPVLSQATDAAPVILRSATKYGAVLTRNSATTGGVNRSTIEADDGASGWRVENFHIIGTALNNGGTVSDQSPIKINSSNAVSGGAYTQISRDIRVTGNSFAGIGEDVMKGVRCRNMVIEGNLIENFTAKSAESIFDFLMCEDVAVRYNTCASTARADDFVTFKAGTLGECVIEYNDVQMQQAVNGRPLIYCGNGTLAISEGHATTAFRFAEATGVKIRRNWLRPTGQPCQGIRMAGGVDVDFTENYLGGTTIAAQCVTLQQSRSAPTGREITLSAYNALNATQQGMVAIAYGRYWVAHPCHGALVTGNVYTGASGSFGIRSFNHPFDNANPQNASIVSPATRGYAANTNTASPGATPPWPVGHLNLPE